MDPQAQFCHNADCPARGQLGLGNIRVHSRTEGNCQMSWMGDSQAAGCFLTPSTKTVPLTTSGRSVEPFNVLHFFDADSISL